MPQKILHTLAMVHLHMNRKLYVYLTCTFNCSNEAKWLLKVTGSHVHCKINWNQLPSSLRQPHFSPCLCPSCSCSYYFFSLCQLTTLTIHNSLSLSLPAQDLPLPQIFPPIDSLPASVLTPRTSRLDRFFWASPFYVFISFVILFCLVSVRQTKLATRQLLGAR